MNVKEQAQHTSAALQKVTQDLNRLEHDLYTSKGNREQIVRLKRVQRALSRDLDKLVKTLPSPVQLSMFTEDDAPRVSASPSEQDHLSKGKRKHVNPQPESVGQQLTLSGEVS